MTRHVHGLVVLLAMVDFIGAIQPSLAADSEGRTIWLNKVPLSTSVSGVVAKVNVQPGDAVKSGDVLLQLNQSVVQAEADYAKANFTYQERLFKEAERELTRNQALYDQTVLAEHELEVAKIAFDKATAEHAQALLTLRVAERALRESTIAAPFDGVVVVRNVEPGQTLVQSQQAPTLLEVADTQTMQVQVFVSAGQARGLKSDTMVAVQVGTLRFSGKIASVAMEAKEGRYEVRVSFPTKGRLVRAGEKATLSFP